MTLNQNIVFHLMFATYDYKEMIIISQFISLEGKRKKEEVTLNFAIQ